MGSFLAKGGSIKKKKNTLMEETNRSSHSDTKKLDHFTTCMFMEENTFSILKTQVLNNIIYSILVLTLIALKKITEATRCGKKIMC